jgi:hypothetical protein
MSPPERPEREFEAGHTTTKLNCRAQFASVNAGIHATLRQAFLAVLTRLVGRRCFFRLVPVCHLNTDELNSRGRNSNDRTEIPLAIFLGAGTRSWLCITLRIYGVFTSLR